MSKSDQLFHAFFKNVFGKSSHHVLLGLNDDVFMHLVHVAGVVLAYLGSVGFVTSATMAIDVQDNENIKADQLFVYGRTVFALPFYEGTVLNFECVLFVDVADTDTYANANDTLLLVFVQLAIVHLVLELVRLVSLPQLVERVLERTLSPEGTQEPSDDVFFLQEVLGDVVTLAIGLVVV